MAYDKKCFQLAEKFMNDFARPAEQNEMDLLTEKLAQRIQNCIDSFMEEEEKQ